ncbi:MAG: cyclic nucleotide-binding domain-containing protein [Aeromicrobium sp.]
MRHAPVPDKEVINRLKELTTLSDSEINEFAKAGRVVHLPAGWGVIWEKTPADAAYYILDGEVSIQRGHQEIATLGAGDFIGEVAIVSHQLRTASVVTTTKVTMLNFSADVARELAAKIPAIGQSIAASTAQRLEVDKG